MFIYLSTWNFYCKGNQGPRSIVFSHASHRITSVHWF